MKISVVIPVLNEASAIQAALKPLQPMRAAGHEVIVVDGGSDDRTLEQTGGLVDRVVRSPRGRARQLRAGVEQASGELFWFLHGDTVVDSAAYKQLQGVGRDDGPGWGRFDVRLSGGAWPFRVIECLMNLRSRLTGIATGDQGIFLRRDWYEAVGGMPDLPLMEDVALSSALRRRGRPLCVRPPLVTSSRRWERHGIARTVLLMWWLRLRYAMGADPRQLARLYSAG